MEKVPITLISCYDSTTSSFYLYLKCNHGNNSYVLTVFVYAVYYVVAVIVLFTQIKSN